MNNLEVIYSYTRKQAIEDGVLIDVSDTATEVGIKYPVAVTSAVWNRYIKPDSSLKSFGQSVHGRLWDMLWMFCVNTFICKDSILYYDVYFLMEKKLELITLKAVCGPGDTMSPVVTIMLSGED
ncbi:MAG: DUF6573 family protein [Dissulfuribacterales bacterium]